MESARTVGGPHSTTGADWICSQRDTVVPLPVLSLGRFHLSLDSRPSSAQERGRRSAALLDETSHTRRRSDRLPVPSEGLPFGSLEWTLGVTRGRQRIAPLAP